jgi:hypothetical protein
VTPDLGELAQEDMRWYQLILPGSREPGEPVDDGVEISFENENWWKELPFWVWT